ncbi:hypothetical protein brsh051_04870 [Brooklawnia propionicigenes]|uniref:Uncharacterized protein n=1 Tax=Brooklawnia propionicigenes TaxID=3041175 RepID=A0AAN0K775_9ACTN|nr:hypothetical protein brsh051_04870 [Brooklawnia sp. SH051]
MRRLPADPGDYSIEGIWETVAQKILQTMQQILQKIWGQCSRRRDQRAASTI